MKILSIEPTRGGDGRLRDLARFSVQINDDLRLVALRLVEDLSGRRLVYSQSAGGSRCATFSPELAKALTSLASEAFDLMEGRQAHDHCHAA